jgi:hypothetical protein
LPAGDASLTIPAGSSKMRFTQIFGPSRARPIAARGAIVDVPGTPTQTELLEAENQALNLGKKGNPCYTIGSRRIAPRRRQASNEEKTNVAEIDFKPSRTTGDGGGNFFYLNRS